MCLVTVHNLNIHVYTYACIHIIQYIYRESIYTCASMCILLYIYSHSYIYIYRLYRYISIYI